MTSAAPDFRTTGHTLVDRLADYLDAVWRREGAVLPWRDPDEQVARWALPEGLPGGAELMPLLEKVIAESNHLHHPRYVGHQVTAPLPEAALCDLVSSLMNNGNAVYEMGPVVTAMEQHVIRFLAEAAGLGGPGGGAGGILTSGGSAGNLTALLAARQAKAGFDAWGGGAHAGPPLAVLVSDQTHYSVARALAIMGLGAGGAWPVPTDARFRLRPHALESARRAAEASGRQVIAVCASAGSTATGAFDPLDAVADFCAEHALWMHVDGAHGAAAVLSETHRGRLAGLGRADSIVWDMHKMLLMPALVTAVLFKDGRRAYQAFAQEASYLFSGAAPEEQWFNLASRTLECTKSMMALKVYAGLAVRGKAFFADYVDTMFARARTFTARAAASADFEVAVAEPDCNIVCFRWKGAGDGEAGDAAQEKIRARMLADGKYYLVQTKLRGRMWLRVTIINPATTEEDLAGLLDEVRAVGKRLGPWESACDSLT